MSRGDAKPGKVSDTVTRLTPMYRVILHNDDTNSQVHVLQALADVFSMNAPQAIRTLLEAHTTGSALCDILPLEQAEFRRDRLQAWSLTGTVEPEV